MLARPGGIPSDPGWRFEPKLDGYRCLVCTHDRFRARSRGGWEVSSLLPEIEQALPAHVQLDGELVAFDDDEKPDFHRLGARMLQRHDGISVSYIVFDVLAFEGESTLREPYRARRELLQALRFDGVDVRLVPAFADGEALFAAVCARGLEGVVAKRERDAYRPGERLWVKTKNRVEPGRVALSRAQQARSDAADTREEAQALRAQAKLQQDRAQRAMSAARAPAAAVHPKPYPTWEQRDESPSTLRPTGDLCS